MENDGRSICRIQSIHYKTLLGVEKRRSRSVSLLKDNELVIVVTNTDTVESHISDIPFHSKSPWVAEKKNRKQVNAR